MTEPAKAEVYEIGDVEERDYPIPTGWRILVEPIKIETETAGGIALPTQSIEAKEHLRYIGRVIAMGPLCYEHDKFGNREPWCEIGDMIAYGAYAGQEVKVRNKAGNDFVSLRLINDDEVLAKIPSPESVVIYC